jgi:tetratricopeptide (TPR) repeat protein
MTVRLRKIFSAFVVASAMNLSATASTRAHDTDDIATLKNIAQGCASSRTPLDLRIKACTYLLDAGVFTDPKLQAITYNNRGGAFALQYKFQSALDDFSDAIRLNQNYETAYFNRGRLYDTYGIVDRAIENYDHAIRLKADYADAYAGRGTAYARLDKFDLAIRDFNEALKLQPDNAGVMANRATAYLSIGEMDDAIADYYEVIRSAPNDTAAHVNLAWLRATASNPLLRNAAEAIDLAEKAVRRNRNNPLYYSVLGVAYASAERRTDSMHSFDRAMDLGGEEVTRIYQGSLKAAGFYDGEITGIADAETRRAIWRCIHFPVCRLGWAHRPVFDWNPK